MRWLVALAALIASACEDREASAPSTGSGSATGSAATATAGDAGTVGACLSGDDEVYLLNGEPLRACSVQSKRCVAIANGAVSASPYAEPHPPEDIPRAAIEDHGGKWATCFDGTCKPLGKRARAALAKMAQDRAKNPPGPDAPEPTGTTDLAAVVVPVADREVEVYHVKKDRLLIDRDPMTLDAAFAVGRVLVTEWSPPSSVVFSTRGKEILELGSDPRPGMIDEDRWLLLSPHHEIYFFDDRPAKPAFRKLALAPVGDPKESLEVDFAVLADKTVAVVMVAPNAASLVRVDPVRGAEIERWPIAVCGAK